MIHVTRRAAVALVAAWVSFSAIPVHATSVVAPNFESMVERADLIFSGRMTSQRCEWRELAGQRTIVTVVNFDVISAHKGQPGRAIELQFLGGTVGEVSLDVSEMPKFKPGERVVLFVEGNGVNASPLVGFYHGRFKLERDSAGREIIKDRHGPVRSTSQIGRAAATSVDSAEPLSHEDFAVKIREVSRKGRK